MTSFGSMCSGIEAASVAWHGLGWRAAWLSEIEAFPSAVLEHHYPDVLDVGDMTKVAALVNSRSIEAPDVLVAGTPCQAFSVAGLRAGLDDSRGQLTLEFIRIADAVDERRIELGKPEAVITWENVPGVLSSKDNAFGCLLAGLAGESVPLVPSGSRWPNAGAVFGPKRAIAWRVFDAQYFGVAQRRRRVFLVASARDGFDPAAVLFEFDGMRRDIAPSRETKTVVAAITASGAGTSGADVRDGQAGHLIPQICGALTAKGPATNGAPEVDAGHVFAVPYRQVAFGDYVDDDTASTSKARDFKSPADLVAYGIPGNWIGRAPENGGNATEPMIDVAPCQTRTDRHAVVYGLRVRRLTPVECERLQGFPDGYTQIPYRGKPAADGPRYKALGNSMAVPCMRWIGTRIDLHLRGLPFDYDPDLDF